MCVATFAATTLPLRFICVASWQIIGGGVDIQGSEA